MNVGNFNASNGWFEKYTKRRGFSYKRIQGEAASVDMAALLQWQQRELREELAKWSVNDVYNLDETGLTWKQVPDKSWTQKGMACFWAISGFGASAGVVQ